MYLLLLFFMWSLQSDNWFLLLLSLPDEISVEGAARKITCTSWRFFTSFNLEELLQEEKFELKIMSGFLLETWTIFSKFLTICCRRLISSSFCRKRSWTRVWSCSKCGKNFQRNTDLRLHIEFSSTSFFQISFWYWTLPSSWKQVYRVLCVVIQVDFTEHSVWYLKRGLQRTWY